MKKTKVFITLGLIVAFFAIMFMVLVSSKTVDSQMYVESGVVKVNGEIVQGRVVLAEGDVIETENGLATVILYESVIINLDSGTRIKVEDLTLEHPKISQEQGTTWNTFTSLLGIEQYSVRTGKSVASVRGTAFDLSKKAGEWKCLVGDGNVGYDINGEKFDIGMFEVVEEKNGAIIKREATEDEKDLIKQKKQRTIESLKKLRSLEIEKNPLLVKLATPLITARVVDLQDNDQLSNNEIEEILGKIDNGEISIEEIEKNVPFKMESVDKIIGLSKEIRELQD